MAVWALLVNWIVLEGVGGGATEVAMMVLVD
jgi:hypothetical protein